MSISLFQHKNLSDAQFKILEIIAYFDIFNHPVNETELCMLVNLNSTVLRIETNSLIEQRMVYSLGNYFSIQQEIQTLIVEREKKVQIAAEYYPKIKKYAQIIQRFPYVRAIAISGSLSKGVMQSDGDIDFFIITAPNRLWTCRSLLILYKKIRLLNSRKYFCLNYFVDTDHLEIIDKNIFTAIELFYLLPIYSKDQSLEAFFTKNLWIKEFVHEHVERNKAYFLPNPNKKQNRVESFFNGKWGNYIEHWLHRITLKRWRKKFKHFGDEKLERAMRSTKGVSKHHPQDFQNAVLTQLHSRLEKISMQ